LSAVVTGPAVPGTSCGRFGLQIPNKDWLLFLHPHQGQGAIVVKRNLFWWCRYAIVAFRMYLVLATRQSLPAADAARICYGVLLMKLFRVYRLERSLVAGSLWMDDACRFGDKNAETQGRRQCVRARARCRADANGATSRRGGKICGRKAVLHVTNLLPRA